MFQRVPLDVLEEVNDPSGRRPPTRTPFGIHGQGFDAPCLHRLTKLPFQEGLDQQREEVHAQQRLNAMNCFEVHRRDLEVSLQLRETFLDHRLPLVGVQ